MFIAALLFVIGTFSGIPIVSSFLNLSVPMYIVMAIGFFVIHFIMGLYEEIDKTEKLLQDETKDLWKNIRELSEFKKEQTLLDVMSRFIDKHPDVVGIQIYKYSIKKNRLKGVTVKVNHYLGKVTEGENINAIIQSYYRMKYFIFERFNKAAKELLIHNDHEKMFKFISRYKKYLDNKDLRKIDEEDVVLYGLLLLGIQWITGIESIYFLNDRNKEKILNEISRSGIFRGILNNYLFKQSLYLFGPYQKDAIVSKKGRMYLMRDVIINSTPHTFVISFDQSASDDLVDDQYATGIVEDLQNMLKQSDIAHLISYNIDKDVAN